MSRDLLDLYRADDRDHARGLSHTSPGYAAMRERDRQRRRRVREILAAAATPGADALSADALSAEALYHAAWILNHGDAPEDARQAHELATESAERGHRPARWLAAAAYDRWRMYRGEPQRYGTQFVPDGTRHRLWDVDPATTDAERAAWDVPPLADQLRRAEADTRANPPGPIGEGAPWWLREAIARWKAEGTA